MADDSVSEAIICEKATQLCEEISAGETSTSTGPVKEFAIGCGLGTDYP